MVQIERDNFLAYLKGDTYSSARLRSELTYIITLALRKNRFPQPAFTRVQDLVGETLVAMRAKPPDLSGDQWFIEMYRLARRVASKFFRVQSPKGEIASDPNSFNLTSLTDDSRSEEGSSEFDIPYVYEEYIASLGLDMDTEDEVYRHLDEDLMSSDPANEPFGLRRALLFAVIM